MPEESENSAARATVTTKRTVMSFITLLIGYLDHLRHGGKPHGKEYAHELKRRLGAIWSECFDRPPADRGISLPAVFATARETSLALMEGRVMLSQLEPEVYDFDGILRWLTCEVREEIRAGRLSWSEMGVANEIEFGVCLLDWSVYYDLLRINPRQATLFGDKVIRRIRAERA